jgi:hypothetical protein
MRLTISAIRKKAKPRVYTKMPMPAKVFKIEETLAFDGVCAHIFDNDFDFG